MATTLQTFIEKINEAFAKGDVGYVIDHVADDVVWNMVGDQEVVGKEAFAQMMSSADASGGAQMSDMVVTTVITHGRQAAAEGTMKMTDPGGTVKRYAFCDVYHMSGFKNAKIKRITSYVIEIG